MASSPSQSPSESAIVEQVITEFFAKSLHIILESRSPYVSSRNYSVDHFMSSPSSSTSSSSSKPRDKWFNLALQDCPAALENFDIWRQSNLEPLVVDIILIRRPSIQDVAPPGGCLLRNLSGNYEFALEPKSEKIVERWIVQYESQKRSSSSNLREIYAGSKKNNGAPSHSSETGLYKKTYERSIILLRSLYSFIRLLPAYKLFHELNSSGQLRPLSLSHRISSFVEPFTRAEEATMSQFAFVPIDTPCGRLSLSVSYLRTLEDIRSEPCTPLSTQFIMDYVGSPTTDPIKRFESLPSARPAPPFVSFTRQHSWSNDYGAIDSVSPPSPTYLDACGMQCDRSLCLPPCSHWSGRPHSDIVKAQPPTASQTQACSPESKLQIKKEPLRSGNFQTGFTFVKAFPFGKDEVGDVPGLVSSSIRRPFSRSSSRLSLLDEFDDSEFACPFADDEDVTESSNRIGTSEGKCQLSENSGGQVGRSPEAVVGALVLMLKTAAPLRQDVSNSFRSSQTCKDESLIPWVWHDKEGAPHVEQSDHHASGSEISASVLLNLRTAADALEELRSYKDMKELILRQGGSPLSDVDRKGGSQLSDVDRQRGSQSSDVDRGPKFAGTDQS